MVLNRDDDWSMANGRCGRKMSPSGSMLHRARSILAWSMAPSAKAKRRLLRSTPETGWFAQRRQRDGGTGFVRSDWRGAGRLIESLKSFAGLPHRVETVAEINGV
jgi:UDP-N-acetylmuramoylalanine--D-glutamate ligase